MRSIGGEQFIFKHQFVAAIFGTAFFYAFGWQFFFSYFFEGRNFGGWQFNFWWQFLERHWEGQFYLGAIFFSFFFFLRQQFFFVGVAIFELQFLGGNFFSFSLEELTFFFGSNSVSVLFVVFDMRLLLDKNVEWCSSAKIYTPLQFLYFKKVS